MDPSYIGPGLCRRKLFEGEKCLLNFSPSGIYFFSQEKWRYLAKSNIASPSTPCPHSPGDRVGDDGSIVPWALPRICDNTRHKESIVIPLIWEAHTWAPGSQDPTNCLCRQPVGDEPCHFMWCVLRLAGKSRHSDCFPNSQQPLFWPETKILAVHSYPFILSVDRYLMLAAELCACSVLRVCGGQ